MVKEQTQISVKPDNNVMMWIHESTETLDAYLFFIQKHEGETHEEQLQTIRELG
jgi:hypothetical protein